jgi:hypothetical protein
MLQAGRSRVRVPMRWIFFDLPSPSSRTMALGSTQPLTEISNRIFPGGGGGGVKGGPPLGVTTLPPTVCPLCIQNVGASTSHNPMVLHSLLQG